MGSLAPDQPDFNGRYPRMKGADFAKQTFGANLLDDHLITEETRIVCFNLPIYDDVILEVSEYAGLSLGVRQATILTEVQGQYDHIAIQIQDDDSGFTN